MSLKGYKSRRNEHQIVISALDGSTVSASDFSEIRFAVSDGAGETALFEKLKSVSGELTELQASEAGTLAYRVNIVSADTENLAARTLYYQVSVTPVGLEPMITDSGSYELREVS